MTLNNASPLEALLDTVSTGLLGRASCGEDRVVFGNGVEFPRDVVLEFDSSLKLKSVRLDAALVFARHAARNGWNWKADIASYVKETREAGVLPVEVLERQKLCDFLQQEARENEAKRPRVTSEREGAVLTGDGLLDIPPGVMPSSCRQLHTRNSILHSKKDLSAVLQIVQAAMRGSSQAKKDGKTAIVAPPAVKSSRYKGVQEQQFWQERLGTRDVDELGIDTNASFLAAPTHTLAAPDVQQSAPVATVAPARKPLKQSHATPASQAGPADKKGGVPLIIVPSGVSSHVLVNMLNVAPFLEDCSFISWEDRKLGGMRKEGTIEIKRRVGRAKPVTYQVTDKPPPKKSMDWARVVAVFVQGSAWQLKEFPFKGAAEGNFLDTFAHVSAFFVRFDSEPAPDFVKKWSVATLVLSKNTRYSDRSVVEGFWSTLDSFLARKGSALAY